jgi:hypothetical protein
MPTEDPRPLENLLDEAGRAVQPSHPGWQDLPRRLEQRPQAGPSRWPRWWLLAPAPLGVAAAVALFLIFGGFPSGPGGPPTALGKDPPPVRVERQDVELTVLSVAETEGETLYMPLLEKVGRSLLPNPALAEAAAEASPYAARGLAINPYGFRPQPARKLTGQALVKDHRLVFNLREGDNVVRFSDVAATIDPTSVRLVSDQPGTVVKEQNFEYDLASADALLQRYLDRKVVCVFRDGREVAGFLAAYDDQALVLASAPTPPPSQKKRPRETQSLTRRELQAIRLNEVPAGLLVKPTLVWKVHADRAGKHDTTLSYLCGFIKWQADYVVVVTPGEGQQPDLLDVTGWVSLDNTSGSTYPKAGLKLIAGDVNRKRDPWAAPEPPQYALPLGRAMLADGVLAAGDGARKEFVEKSFFEYHLYTLTAPSTVRDRQVKQLNLLKRSQVKANRRYVYDFQVDNRRLGIELVAKNEKENNLGLPLPKGRVTFEQRDVDGETGFLGRTDIDHTTVKEELTLNYGYAFDVAGEYRQLNYQQPNPRQYITTNEIRVRNHKTSEVQVRAVARLGSNWKITQETMPHLEHDFQTVYFDFPLKANEERVITYTVEYNH